jgi:hypothetical protein
MVIASLTTVSIMMTITHPIISEPADFYGTSKKVSLEEMVTVANQNNISIYLPNTLPHTLELTAIYLKESPFVAIMVYSSEVNKDYKTAELTLQIASVDPNLIPTYAELQSEAEKSPDENALQINNWPILIQENAYAGGNRERIEKYGEYTMLINIWIEEVWYLYNAPTLTLQDAVEMIEAIQLITSG